MAYFAETIDVFLGDQRTRLKPTTLYAYRKELRAAARLLPCSIESITTNDIRAYLEHAPTPSTAARRRTVLHVFFAWAIREAWCAADPTASLATPRIQRRLPRPIRADADRLLVERAISAAPQPFHLAFTILRETGMRAGEVVGINIGDVTLDPGREALHIREAKNGTERVVVLGPTATPKSIRGLRAYMRAHPHEPALAPLLRSNRGTRLSYDALHYQWTQLCQDAGLMDANGRPRYTLHQLRHTRATELVEQGQRMEIVQRVLGHRDPRSTQCYAELHEAQVRAALETGR